MLVHPELDISVITSVQEADAMTWRFLSNGMNHVHVDVEAETPTDMNGYPMVITTETTSTGVDTSRIPSFFESGGTWLAIAARSMAADNRPERGDGG